VPLVYLVFMPMRANVHEAEAFVDLCAEAGVDRLVCALNYSDDIDLDWEREGYRFPLPRRASPSRSWCG
jgi:hypothetical protein